MKRIILAVTILLILTGCDKTKQQLDDNNPNLKNEEVVGKYETENIKLLNRQYNSKYNEEENIAFLDEVQGHITHIDNGGTSPIIVANNKLYFAEYGFYMEKASFPSTPDSILFFDNMTIGENVYYFKDDKISLYSADGDGGVFFDNIEFNKDTDFVIELGLSSYFFMMTKKDNSYNIKYYERDERTNQIELYSEKVLRRVETPDYNEIEFEDFIVITSNRYGYCLYVITDDNDVYWVDEVNSNGTITTSTKTPYITNVDKIFASADVGNNLPLPIYSKIGDSTNLYSGSPGNDIFDTSDNLEISFQIPDNHTTKEIKDIFQISDYLVFVFNNGDVYITDEIEKEDKDNYEMKKLDDITKLNNEGKVIDMAGSSVMDNNLYLLMDDGKLYYKEIEL